jgi:hypothetical protein
MSLSVDELQVTTFETTTEPGDEAVTVTPTPDSPLCVPSWNGTCPETV